MEKHLGSYFREHNQRNGLKIIPLEEVYFHNAQYEVDNIKQGNQRNVIILGLVALAILFIASFSYVNLSIAKALERGKEVGVRKTLGANRGQVVFQFLVETKVILLIAMALAITCCLLIRPLLNNTFNLDITFNWMSSEALIFLVILFFVLLLAAGLYPALVLGAFKPLTVLRKNYLSQGRSLFLRKGLITVQFCLAIFLVSVTCFTYLQVQYMNDKDLGYTTERTLVIDPSGGAIYDTLNTFRQILAAHPNIKSITGASGEPSGFHDVYGITFKPGTEPIRANTVFTDVHYLKALDIEVIKGRAFDPSRKTDRESAMMINEQVLKELGVSAEEVIGNVVDVPFREYKRKVIGVFEDYHFMDLRAAVQPQAIIMDEEVRRIIIKIGAGDVTETLVFIEDTYNSFSAGYPMNSTFLEDSLAQQYQTEQQQATLFSLFSGISIVLACLGIFGLVSFSANRRQKEMSIRKVFGASASQILLILSKEYVQLVGLSALLSLPIIWYYLSDWLDDYAYRIDLFSYSPVFILASTLTLIVAFLAIVIKAYKAAVVNPAEIMRYE
ncbi:MAG: ABC transporter permease [Thermonemataceae bacterium]